MKKNTLSVWQASCIITGYSIGGGILAIPYIASKNGILMSLILLAVAFLSSFILHSMIAEAVSKNNTDGQIISTFSLFLFRGKWKKLLTTLFFLLITVILVTNLTAYILGAADVISGVLPISPLWGKLIFYIAAATVVVFGLKAVGISESFAVILIFILIAVLSAASLLVPHHVLPWLPGSISDALSYFSMTMMALSAFFSVPQALEGLNGDMKKTKLAIFIGQTNNTVIILAVMFCSLLASNEVTEVAMTGWSAGIGSWAQIIGGLFTVLAMLTTYWSISLSLSGIVREQFGWDNRLCWLLATAPSLIFSLCNIAGYIDFLEMAAGACAIIVACMVVPAYRNSRKEIPGTSLGVLGSTPFQILSVVAYLLMAIGSLV